MNDLVETTLFTPLNIAIAVGLGVLLSGLIIMARARKRKAKRAAGKQVTNAYTLILRRGSGPVGAILPGQVPRGNHFVIGEKSANPVYVPFDNRFITKNTQADGEPFLEFDMESQHLVKYEGVGTNDDDYTIVYHDGVVEDVDPDTAKGIKQLDEIDPANPPKEGEKVAYRKHASLWRRWPGSRIFQELTTNDWDVIQRTTTTWLALLQQYGMPILIVLGVAGIGLTIAGLAQ